MILCDLSHIAISTMIASGDKHNMQTDPLYFKSAVYNTLKSYKQKYGKEYGQIVICCDSRKYWRADIFKHYKKNRKPMRDKSPLDWNAIYSIISDIKLDLKQFFPYKVIEIDGVEADDIIAILSLKTPEKTIIIASDEDFLQLQKNPLISQYSILGKKMLISEDPEKELHEKIVRGDSGDGIPSVLCEDDFYVNKEKYGRAPPVTAKVISECKKDSARYIRNKKLIDFSEIPQKIVDNILEEYKIEPQGNQKKLYEYFIQNKMRLLIPEIGSF